MFLLPVYYSTTPKYKHCLTCNLQETFDLPEDALEYVDVETFEQILEMDDGDPDRDFSRGLVFGFFEQAKSTFDEMDDSMCVKRLPFPAVRSYQAPDKDCRLLSFPRYPVC
ncbi:hypothetical protein TWF102_001180 [Orbilia oligospora]|uniref:Uncharacterized protein n=1 Tax=Orbilia oligospora TaxID=2813651 RepID=A0A7C8N4T0_ORBOL|nr:hypothetical protein TWF706_003618 [Orbilia oligospora]KAF3082482.1 hypothetical protein TWF102_001180 [Orbilia oligospora]KAF3108527.1 hypothetical protein TWF103_005600 [Orbilia oligospora]KAF3147681.1 hypothetical protein TWF594_002272 [Orbilia oligospora]